VAIKVLSGPGFKPSGVGERYERRMDLIRREVSSLMMLRHPHILLACGFTTKEHNKKSTPSIALISELCRGGSVSTRIHNSRDMKVPAAVLISIQVSYAMTYLHGIGLQHRDIKAQNVLLVAHSLAEPHAKLGDFGLIRDVLKRTQGTPDVGTRGYCAPEIFAGEDYSYKADVYSFGLFLFEILSQRYPYDAEDMRRIHCERNRLPYESTFELTHLDKFDAIEWAATQGRIPDYTAFDLLAAKQATKHVQDACKGLITECLAKESGDRPDALAISNRLEAVIIPK
jgi:serine/threonine protein kinase